MNYTIPHIVATEMVELEPDSGTDISPKVTTVLTTVKISCFVKIEDELINVQVMRDPTFTGLNTFVETYHADPRSPNAGLLSCRLSIYLAFIPSSVTLNEVGRLVVHE
jgi:hypothetical protein